MISPQYSNQKFYGKWLYKITLRMPGVTALRIGVDADFMSIFLKRKNNLTDTEEQIIELAKTLSELNKSDYSKRIESNLIDIYVNDQTIYNSLLEKFNIFLKHHFIPRPDVAVDRFDSRSIFVDKLPHNKYLYKIYLQPHKFGNDKEYKENLIAWLENQPGMLISNTTKQWFIKTEWNWDRRYMYVENEQALLMLKLRSSDAVGTVCKYHIVDK
jgi:hypothetical protein